MVPHMTKLFKNRLLALMAAALMIAVLAGCGGETETPAPATPVAAAPAPAPAPVDKGAIVTEAAAAFFDNLPTSMNMIDAADVKKRLAAGEALFLVDIRSAADFEKAHAVGATNIPFATMGQNHSKLPKDKLVVVNCYSGQTSGQTVALLKVMGYNAISVKGGFPAYEKAEVELKKAS